MSNQDNPLQANLDQANLAVRGLQSQLVAHKKVIENLLEQSYETRTNLDLYQKSHEELMQVNQNANAKIQLLESQLSVATAELEVLKNPPAPAIVEEPQA